jgi:hypothetical protein
MLDENELAWLTEKGFCFKVIEEPGVTNVILNDYPLPNGFDHDNVEILIRLPAGFPDVPPDMFWVKPTIKLTSTQKTPVAADCHEKHLDDIWQRFSRHLPPGTWRPGVDDLRTWVQSIRQLLQKDAIS